MKSREKLLGRRGSFRMWPLELLMGILILSGVFLFVTNKDMQKTEEHLASTVGYIKEQCNQYGRMTLASETKSLLRAPDRAAADLAASGRGSVCPVRSVFGGLCT